MAFDGVDVSTLGHGALKGYYRQVQGVFQDPFSSYNPIFKADRVFTMIRSAYFPELSGHEWRAKLDRALRTSGSTPKRASASTRTS